MDALFWVKRRSVYLAKGVAYLHVSQLGEIVAASFRQRLAEVGTSSFSLLSNAMRFRNLLHTLPQALEPARQRRFALDQDERFKGLLTLLASGSTGLLWALMCQLLVK